MRRPILFLLVAFVMTSCLPSSCRREGPEALFPADSLSRNVAALAPADTVEAVWGTTGTEDHPMEFPRTVQYDGANRIYVSDARRNSLFAFDTTGTFIQEITADAFDIPYLAGARGDTLIVYNAGTDQVTFLQGGTVVGQQAVTIDRPQRETLLYVAATDTALYVKVVGEEIEGYIARLGDDRATEARAPLPGPHWRHAGFLEVWGDSLLSLSGFRPVVDILPLGFDGGAMLDTMALVGFDSPMLARSRAFSEGDVARAPLLSASADPAGDRLFVLNMRPGWVQVDVYDRSGQLEHRIVEDSLTYQNNFYPRDLAVWPAGSGAYALAVTLTAPEPQLKLFRWRPQAEPVADRTTVPGN